VPSCGGLQADGREQGVEVAGDALVETIEPMAALDAENFTRALTCVNARATTLILIAHA